MKDAKKYKAFFFMGCRIGGSGGIWSMGVLQQGLGETLSLDIETLPSNLMNFQWNREQKWNGVRVSIVYALSEGPKL